MDVVAPTQSSCASLADLLSASVDHETTAAEEAVLQRHLDRCADCRERLVRFDRDRRARLLHTATASHDALRADIALARATSAGSSTAVVAATRHRLVRAVAGAAASIAVLAGIVVVSTRPGGVPIEAAAGDGSAISRSEGISAAFGHSTNTVIELGSSAVTRSELIVSSGSSVTWRNVSEHPHELVRFGAAVDAQATLDPGQEETMTFHTPGTYSFDCLRHRGMAGTIVVTA